MFRTSVERHLTWPAFFFPVGPDGWLYYMSLLRGGQVIRLRVKGVTPPVNPTKPKPTTSKKVVKTTTRPPPDPLCTPTGAKKIVVPTCAVAVGKQPMDTIMYVSREGWPSERVRFMQNGMWGPVGLDASVGNKSTNSGRSMGINNQWFISGYGTHAWSKIQLNGNKCCYRFTSSVGVDDEVRRFYGNWAYNVTGEWSVISADTGATLYNSTRALGRPIKLGDNPVSVDVKNLHLHNAITLNAQVPLRINPVSYNDFTPAHLDWAETKMYCGPKAPYTPIITMMTPLPGTRVLPGGKVAFSAKAVAWDGATPIPPSGFLWTVDLVHCQGFLCHTHTPFYSTLF